VLVVYPLEAVVHRYVSEGNSQGNSIYRDSSTGKMGLPFAINLCESLALSVRPAIKLNCAKMKLDFGGRSTQQQL